MYRVVYVSSARTTFSEAELEQLLTKSRAANEAVGVTGLLLYHDGNFIQALEGPKKCVEAVLQRIEKDPRHGNVLVLIQEEDEERVFGDWSMGYVRYRELPEGERDGYSRFLEQAAARELAPSRAHVLLEAFKRNVAGYVR